MVADRVDGRVARRAVHEGPVGWEHVGAEVLEGEVAVGAVGERAVCVERVVVVVQGCAVEMHLVDEYIVGVGAGLVGLYCPDVEEGHIGC